MKRNEILGEISDKALRSYRQGAHTEIQGAKFGKGKGTPEGEKTIAKREKGMAAAGKRLKARDDEKRANYKRPEPAKTSSGPQDWYGQNRYMGDSVEQGVAEGSGANKTDLAMAYLMAVVNAPIGTSEKRRISNWQQILDYKFDIEMDTATLAQMLPQLDSQLQAGKLDKLQNRMISRGELSIESIQQGVSEGLEEGRSDYVGDAIEGLRMAKPGLEKEDFLDELYSYIDAEMGMEAAEAAFADKDAYDEWYESYADAVDENANMLKVAKDDDKQTILQNPSTGVQTQIDKTNPNAPSLTKDDATGKLKLAAPAQGGASAVKPNLVGKDVEVATESADLAAMLKIAGLR